MDYTGDVGVILKNHHHHTFIISHGDRIAQMVINKYERIDWNEVNELTATDRGEGGFGHTGKK